MARLLTMERSNRSMAKLVRQYFHYEQLEEYHAGMWRTVHGEETDLYRKASAELLANPEAFRNALEIVLRAWPNSCAAALSAEECNRIAWLGWAACCLEENSPEFCTRLAWHDLSVREQNEANAVANETLCRWEREHGCENEPTLFAWSGNA